jgi:hypothetical protein
MTRYEYRTVHMRLVGSLSEGQPFVRYEKGFQQSTLFEVLAEFAASGWRYVEFVPRGPAGSDQLVFEREVS